MAKIFAVLFAVALGVGTLVINPFGASRADVWVTPKVIGSSTALVFALVALLGLERTRPRAHRHAGPRQRPRIVHVALGAWLLALVASTLASSSPVLSIVGYPVLVEGSAFYTLLTLLGVVVYRLARSDPRVRPLLISVAMIVGSVATLLAIPQKYAWTLDYTVVSARLEPGAEVEATPAGVWKIQSPNSVFWHRGHFGFVAALGAAASVLALRESRGRGALPIAAALATVLAGVMISDTRAPQLAGLVALVLALLWPLPSTVDDRVLVRRYRRTVVAAGALALAASLAITTTAGSSRQASFASVVAGSAPVYQLGALSSRDALWGVAYRAWLERPWFGTGFLSFNDALGRWQVSRAEARGVVSADGRTVSVTEFFVVVRDGFATVWVEPLIGSKPHNALLELLASVGLVGTLAALVALTAALWCARRLGNLGPPLYLLAVGGTYLAFWYESVQYSPLFWAMVAGSLAPRRDESDAGPNAATPSH